MLYLNRNPLLAQATSTGIHLQSCLYRFCFFYLEHVAYWYTGLVCGMGDVIAQQIIERKATVAHDWRRTAKMAAIGFCFTVTLKWFLFPFRL